jgi:Bacterial protein of unknown function (DUF899)
MRHQVVSRDEWLKARVALLKEEKALTRRSGRTRRIHLHPQADRADYAARRVFLLHSARCATLEGQAGPALGLPVAVWSTPNAALWPAAARRIITVRVQFGCLHRERAGGRFFSLALCDYEGNPALKPTKDFAMLVEGLGLAKSSRRQVEL